MARNHMLSLFLITLLSIVASTFGLTLERRISNCGGLHSTCDNCCGNFCCGPQDDCVGGRCRPISPPPPPPPEAVQDIGMHIQYQESSEWCWIAVATSVNHFYDPASSWTQCAVMTDVGRSINHYSGTVCPSAATLATYPNLASALSNPYSTSALNILDSYTWGNDTLFLKSGGVDDPLRTMGNFGSDQGTNPGIAAIATELNNRRPVVVDITWPNLLQHVVVISGLSNDWVSMLILDPTAGETIMHWSDFPAKYNGGATINSYTFTQG